MTQIITGMTPAQFISALSDNFTELATSIGVETNQYNRTFVSVLISDDSEDLITKLNHNFRNNHFSFGMSNLITLLNNDLAVTFHRFQDNFVEDILPTINAMEPTMLVSDDGNQIDLWSRKYYSYSTDGITYAEPALIDIEAAFDCAHILKYNGTYYMYIRINGNAFHLYTSSNKINWTSLGEVFAGATGEWDSGLGSPFVWNEGSNWYMLYEAAGDVQVGFFAIGLATATAPEGPWTRYISNPIITGLGEGVGRPTMGRKDNNIVKYNGRYYLYYHYDCSGALGSIYRANSIDLHTWLIEGSIVDIHVEHGAPLISYGDPAVIEFKGKTYLFFDCTSQSEDQTQNHIDLSIDNRTLTEILALKP